jgi:hypothetical protein
MVTLLVKYIFYRVGHLKTFLLVHVDVRTAGVQPLAYLSISVSENFSFFKLFIITSDVFMWWLFVWNSRRKVTVTRVTDLGSASHNAHLASS